MEIRNSSKHRFVPNLILTLWIMMQALYAQAAPPLPSWNEGATRSAIIQFVQRTTTPGSPDFVPEAERIATFDNDGTLWTEQPLYTQVLFMVDRIRQLAPQHPEWQTQEPFASVLKGDLASVLKGGEKNLVALAMASHAGMSTDEFHQIVLAWLLDARHPVTHQPFTSMVYQPMLELLDYLRSNGFKVWIVTGGGVEFLRAFAEKTYGIPPERVIGSSLKTQWNMVNGQPVIMRLPEISSVDDKEGKPLNIQKIIGRRPVFAAGNSDGDLPMLQWTAAGQGTHMALLVHHTDGVREVAYDRHSSIGQLDKALDAANSQGWTVVDMKKDWRVIYPFENGK